MDETRIRLATEADGSLIAALRRSWVEENAGHEIRDDDFATRFDAWFAREHEQRLTWLAVDDGSARCVGMLNVLIFTRMPSPGRALSQWGYLANFYVTAERRNTGLGTRMLAACTSYADATGLVRIVLSPSEASVPLYERAGFAPATGLMLREPH